MKAKTLNFTISSDGGGGSYFCMEQVTEEVFEYFKKKDLDLNQYALNDNYAKEKKIPKKMRPFEPGVRAEFGYSKSGMSASDYLSLTIESEDYEEVFSGEVLKSNIKNDDSPDLIKDAAKGVYAAGYEGLEDCYISGELELNEEFDIKKFKVFYEHIDYKLSEGDMISSITYNNKEVDWYLGSYEGTGDNSFGFVVIK